MGRDALSTLKDLRAIGPPAFWLRLVVISVALGMLLFGVTAALGL